MNRNSQPQLLKFLVPLVLFLVSLFFNIHTSYADVGTAALYSPPYLPTACYGSDESKFPSSNLFAAAGDAIWANGTACGRLYLVKCITTTSTPFACNQNQTIQIKIVDHHHINGQEASAQSAYNTTLFLSPTAFGTTANSSTSSFNINIEFEQVHGEDVVPLARGPVSPSAPNPTTDDRRVPLARGMVSPSAPNPTIDDRRGHYKVHGEDVVPLARGPVSPSAPNPATDDRRGHYKVHGEDVPLARGPVSPSATNPTTDDRRVPLTRGPVSPSTPNPTTDDQRGHYP